MSLTRSFHRWWLCAALVAAGTVVSAGSARAAFIVDSFADLKSDPAYSGPGEFTGKFEVDNISTTSAVLRVTLTNTSLASSGGYITGFAFNNPGNVITGATETPTLGGYTGFQLIGGPTFNNTVEANPLGKFDIGAAVGANWLGGGSPTTGILAGQTGQFVFNVTGMSGLDTMTALDILSTLSKLTGGGEEFVVRFRGFTTGASDKVGTVVNFGTPPPPPPPPPGAVPAPAGLVLGLIGFGGCALGRGIRRRNGTPAAV